MHDPSPITIVKIKVGDIRITLGWIIDRSFTPIIAQVGNTLTSGHFVSLDRFAYEAGTRW